jgi:GH15 family glucan-1,4-alpha-glucosidase
MYPYGLIGNCQLIAMVDSAASIKWLCLPRPDSPPFFGELLDDQGGAFNIKIQGQTSSRSYYLSNTNVLVTELSSSEACLRVIDFCPRFEQHGRMYRPIVVMRKLEVVRGQPLVKVDLNPVSGWEKSPLKMERGNSHLRFDLKGDQVRLLTNMPLTYLVENNFYQIKSSLYFALSWNLPIEDELVHVCESFLTKTIQYWRQWVKHCNIPTLFQNETIRSALVLKLHVYEDTGAILAAPTTSLPEEFGKNRNWDYRYCWLRDGFFVLSAFHNLGHFEEMEGFLKFLLQISLSSSELSPVYTLDGKKPIPELTHDNWGGYLTSKPVRSGNLAADQIQNDAYGEMILALAPIYFDERFADLRSPQLIKLMNALAQQAVDSVGKSDAGLWEFREGWREHSFTNLMCWAGLERLWRLTIQKKIQFQYNERELEKAMLYAADRIKIAANSDGVRNGPDDASWDSSMLLMGVFHFPDARLVRSTVESVERELTLTEGFLYRYRRHDDFGEPQSAFLICSFWLIQAWARLGEVNKAKAILEKILTSKNSLGLFSEHYTPAEKIQSGNFPQAYSHVGLINAAFSVSPPWSDWL